MLLSMLGNIGLTAIIVIVVVFFGILALVMKWWKKAEQGKALVRTGTGGTKVNFSGIMVVPVLHRLEVMDLTVKTIVISRMAKDGLICQDNMRADIKVNFFVRVNKTKEDVQKVAQTIGCARASDQDKLVELFEAKFSEALKTVGKQFDFVDLYNSREKFRIDILNIIGTDLNGYTLDDCAIDFLEQTPVEILQDDNILDSEGIKKITEITAEQSILSNKIRRDKEMTITKQDVEAREAILELEKQLAEKEESQKREVENIKDRENAAIEKVKEEQRWIAESTRIQTDEQVAVAEENKQRQVIVAQKNKEKVDAVETEKVEQDRALQATERERIVTLAQIEKDKAVEEEKKNIQDVIKARVMVEKETVSEQEKIKDTVDFAKADRAKKVAITNAEMWAQQDLVKQIKAAEAQKQAAEFNAETKLIDATAEFDASSKQAEAMKIIADAKAAEEAAMGIAEAQVIEAKAEANLKQGETDAKVIEMTADAEAKGIEVKSTAEAGAITKTGNAQAEVTQSQAGADEEKGMAEARVMAQKYDAEAQGIGQKADAMKQLDGVGKEHEEFKLRLNKDQTIELASINIQKDIADAQAQVIAEALKAANIDIVGGDTMFFDKIMGAITRGKSVDRMVDNSVVIQEVKDQILDTENGKTFKDNLKNIIDKFGITSEDLKNLSISNLLLRMSQKADDNNQGIIEKLFDAAQNLGIGDKTGEELGLI